MFSGIGSSEGWASWVLLPEVGESEMGVGSLASGVGSGRGLCYSF